VASREQEQEGWRCLEEGRLEEAEGFFRRALELDPDRAEALLGLGQVYLHWDELHEAAELFQMAMALAEPRLPRGRRVNPRDAAVRAYVDGLGFLALTRIRRLAWEEAVGPLQEILAWDEDGRDGEAYLHLGYCQHRLGEMAEALAAYGAARPRHPAAWYLYGLAALKLGRLEEAVQSFQEGWTVWPEAATLLAYWPRVIGLPRRGAYAMTVLDPARFTQATIDLWSNGDQRVLRQALFGDEAAAP
jgi:tetratricopeptide (TPR) repeat protein